MADVTDTRNTFDKDGRITLGGSSNAYTATTARPITGYFDGLRICGKANHANTGAATLNINNVGATAIRKLATTALSGGEILNNKFYDFIYDDANSIFQAIDATPIADDLGIDGIDTAWGTYAPTLTPGSGAFTTTSTGGRYKQVGKTVSVTIEVVITDKGTAAGSLTVSLPTAAVNASRKYILSGMETALNGKAITGRIDAGTSGAAMNYADNSTSVIIDSTLYTLTGIYEAA